jgi:biotin-dependent carboxylase-like uncharacterized protein
MANGLRVLKAGSLALLQDCGRFGAQGMGLTCGGAMDEHAARWANRLLHNRVNAALLEMTLGNVAFEADVAVQIALTGAECDARINGEPCQNWCSHRLEVGDRLDIGWARSGMRSYLAVAGGFSVTPEFGSVSTVVREGIGGLDGGAVKAGQTLPVAATTPDGVSSRCVPSGYVPDYEAERHRLRLVPGYQHAQFDASLLDAFYAAEYRLMAQSDRMGMRFSGPPLVPPVAGILSEGICFGAVQVPPDGQPIIMMKDRQTLGGYPKIGAVLPLDLFRLSQLRAGTRVYFEPVTQARAQALMCRFYRFFGGYR